MISIDDAKFLQGTRVTYLWQPVPWEVARHESAIIMGRTAKRVKILHINASDAGDTVKLVSPNSLYEEPTA